MSVTRLRVSALILLLALLLTGCAARQEPAAIEAEQASVPVDVSMEKAEEPAASPPPASKSPCFAMSRPCRTTAADRRKDAASDRPLSRFRLSPRPHHLLDQVIQIADICNVLYEGEQHARH